MMDVSSTPHQIPYPGVAMEMRRSNRLQRLRPDERPGHDPPGEGVAAAHDRENNLKTGQKTALCEALDSSPETETRNGAAPASTPPGKGLVVKRSAN